MPILADCHMHSIHSGDSKTPMEEMVLKSIAQGLTTICFTEHNDFGFPITDLDPKGKFECNADTYFKDYSIIDSIRQKAKNMPFPFISEFKKSK